MSHINVISTYEFFILYKELLKSTDEEWTPLAWTSLSFHENPSKVIRGDRLTDTINLSPLTK
jgi:hypothetical protein